MGKMKEGLLTTHDCSWSRKLVVNGGEVTNGWKGGKRRICSGARTTEKVVVVVLEEKYLLVIGGGRSGGMKLMVGGALEAREAIPKRELKIARMQ